MRGNLLARGRRLLLSRAQSDDRGERGGCFLGRRRPGRDLGIRPGRTRGASSTPLEGRAPAVSSVCAGGRTIGVGSVRPAGAVCGATDRRSPVAGVRGGAPVDPVAGAVVGPPGDEPFARPHEPQRRRLDRPPRALVRGQRRHVEQPALVLTAHDAHLQHVDVPARTAQEAQGVPRLGGDLGAQQDQPDALASGRLRTERRLLAERGEVDREATRVGVVRAGQVGRRHPCRRAGVPQGRDDGVVVENLSHVDHDGPAAGVQREQGGQVRVVRRRRPRAHGEQRLPGDRRQVVGQERGGLLSERTGQGLHRLDKARSAFVELEDGHLSWPSWVRRERSNPASFPPPEPYE